MDRFDEGWEYDAEYESDFDSAFDLDDAEGLYLSLIPDEERQRLWSERVWADTTEDEVQHDWLLFAERGAEAELGKEVRLSELWGSCQDRPFTMNEFLELSMLVTEVNGIRGALCTDCAMLNRPNVSANWALATTHLCRGHLRFRLGHAEIDGGSARTDPPSRSTRQTIQPVGAGNGQNGDVTLAARVYNAAHLTGTFVLRSGRTADRYFDKYRFESDPALLAEIVAALAPLVPPGVEGLAGLELGGVPLATMLSSVTGLPAFFVRKQPKKYGTEQVCEGGDIAGRNLLIVEDVVTTGGQLVLSAQDLRSEGGVVQHALCVIDRQGGGADVATAEGITLRALFTMSELETAV